MTLLAFIAALAAVFCLAAVAWDRRSLAYLAGALLVVAWVAQLTIDPGNNLVTL